ncbi:cytochrome b/b6 domain-containing protein [Corynebacterium pacaense]|uniref:cytochrome b/b6 domain-containing protein n=1 Tax=Corynebacterium pacaense TaxID=1816684 RepID=UPI001FE6501E|nr:cytochrome b/b6 domain-containing protein [Corynebacterium pacaense]
MQLVKPLTRQQWAITSAVLFAGVFIAAVVAVLVAKWLVGLEPVAQFIDTYPGKYDNPAGAPVGIPAWLGWQHFLNMFFLVLIIRTGIQINRQRRPRGFWTPRKGGKKISLTLWIHLSLDLFWILNGIVFYILLFATGQWMRIVPTSWEFFPNAISAGLQYVSLDWPTENGWANYNSLQELTYFLVVFVAAPLSIISGLRMSAYWPSKNRTLGKLVPMELARKIHLPVMVFYVVFAAVHVFLVFATGALRNLNHMYAAQDGPGWTGFWWFLASMVAIIAGIIAVRPSLVAPVAKLFGTVTAR